MKRKLFTILKNKWFWLDQINDVLLIASILLLATGLIPKAASLSLLITGAVMFVVIGYMRKKECE